MTVALRFSLQMATGVTTICNILSPQSGVAPSAPSTLQKNTPQTTDPTTSPEYSTDDCGSQTRNTPSDKGNRSFDETLRKKIDSHPVPKEASDDKKKKEQDLEPANPETMVPVASNTACLFIPQSVKVEDAELLELSSGSVPPPEGSNKSQVVETMAAPAVETVVGDKTAISENPLTPSVPADSSPAETMATGFIPPPAPTTRQAIEKPIASVPIESPQASAGLYQNTLRVIPIPAPQTPFGNAQTSADSDGAMAAKELTASDTPENFSSDSTKETPGAKIPPTRQNTEAQTAIRDFTGLVENTSQPKSQQNTLPKQENLSPEQVLAVQAEGRKNTLSAKEGFNGASESAQPLSGGVPGWTAVAEQIPRTPYAGEVHTTGADPARQIAETIRSSYQPGTQQITIRLDPPGVGKVMIRFIERSDGITGLLQVDNPQTRYEIQQALPGLIQTLQNADIQVKKLEVVQTSLQDNAASGEHLAGQHNGSGQHHPAAPHALPGTPSYNQWRSNAELLNDPTGPQLQQITDHSINLLF